MGGAQDIAPCRPPAHLTVLLQAHRQLLPQFSRTMASELVILDDQRGKFRGEKIVSQQLYAIHWGLDLEAEVVRTRKLDPTQSEDLYPGVDRCW